MTCCETCPLAIAFMVEPGWPCQLHLVNETDEKCEKRLYLDRKAADRGMTIEQMIKSPVDVKEKRGS